MQRKFFIGIVTVLLLGAVISGGMSARMVEDRYKRNIEENLITELGLIRELIGEKLIYERDNLDKYTAEIKSIINARITITDAKGDVISDTEYEYTAMDNHALRPEISEALKGGIGKAVRFSDTLKADQLYIAQPVFRDGSVIGVIRLSRSLHEINILIRRLYSNVFIGILAGLAVSLLLGYRVSMSITKPVKEITYTASQIASGQLDKRVNLTGKDEIGVLAASINNMASKLNDTIMSLQDKNTKLEAIMSSMVNGIIAVDKEERILFINPVAVELLNIKEEDIIGRHLLQVVRSNVMDDYLKVLLQGKMYFDTEIVIDYPEEKTLKLFANPIMKTVEGGVVGVIITIQDITKLRKLERMRTEFVTNVSHELKTPLTSIKGFAETLKNGAIEDKEDAVRFLDIIEAEAERLHRLISDILSLSELEQKKNKMIAEEIEIDIIVEEVVSMLKTQADKKKIELIHKVQKDIKRLTGDPDKLKQMLINLVENAIKYTPEKGCVTVEACNASDPEGGDMIAFNIMDNGIGIPRQNIPRLFERFYRVDKARSRKIGGTGLGLAIVKHIVILFNGEIEVQSELGRGTTFTVTLPVKQ
jgi:two-component system phosphate regulon sensor histidine kinase PhoR